MKALIFAKISIQNQDQISKTMDFCTKHDLGFSYENDIISDFDLQEQKDCFNMDSSLYLFQNIGECIIRIAHFEQRMATWNWILRKQKNPESTKLANSQFCQFTQDKVSKQKGGTFGQIYSELLQLLLQKNVPDNIKTMLSKIKDNRDYIVHNLGGNFIIDIFSNDLDISSCEENIIIVNDTINLVKECTKKMLSSVFNEAEIEEGKKISREEVFQHYKRFKKS